MPQGLHIGASTVRSPTGSQDSNRLRKVSARGAHGRFVVVEPMHDCSRGLTREKQVAQHDIAIEIVDEELRAAGFEVVERDTSFIKFTAVPGGFWLLVARRP